MTNVAAAMTALGDPTRQAIFERLVERPRPVGELAGELPVTRPAVSQHLKVLKDAGLVIDRRVGTRRVYQVDPQAVADLRAYFDAFWDQSLAAFRDAAETEEKAMVDQQEQSGVAVRHSIVVEAPQDRAFTVFTQRMQSWWPMESHRIGGKPITDLVTEPHAGGRWYERAEDGSECDWGRVVAWEPPARVVLTWQISHDWKPAPEIHTEIEVRFTPEGEDRTRVDLEHRGLEAFGEHTAQMRSIFGSDGGWGGLLARFAATAGGAG